MLAKVKLALLLMAGVAMVSADQRPSFRYRGQEGANEEHADNEDEGGDEGGEGYGSYGSSEAKYSFEWSVEDDSSENHFGHQESRDGDQTEGSYYVQLPDGRLMTVTYHVDGYSGFVPEVTFEGEAEFEEDSDESEEESDESEEDSDESGEGSHGYYSR